MNNKHTSNNQQTQKSSSLDALDKLELKETPNKSRKPRKGTKILLIIACALLLFILFLIVPPLLGSKQSQQTIQQACEEFIKDNLGEELRLDDMASNKGVATGKAKIDDISFMKKEDDYHVFWVDYTGYSNYGGLKQQRVVLYCHINDQGTMFYSENKY